MSAVFNEPQVAFRPMRDADLPAVMEVERAAYPHPWSEGIFRDCLRVGYCCWLTLADHRIIGFGIMSTAVGECHILNLCIHPDWQGRQLGRKTLYRLFEIARRRKVETAFLEVRRSNRAAIALYEQEGFGEVGIRRRYYPCEGGWEDAIVMARQL